MMLSIKDLQQLSEKCISESQVIYQLKSFETGFPFLKIINAASPEQGITIASDAQINELLETWDAYLKTDASILKFVPASGAASRMFKDLYEFLDADYAEPTKPAEIKFITEIKNFAFYDALNECCLKNNNKSIDDLIENGETKAIVSNLLTSNGLNYGALPKGLLLFHTYNNEKRTSLQEHLVEGGLYASNASNEVNIHFTVSAEHRKLFEKHVNDTLPEYENVLGKKFNISFSEQKPSTDTIAADEQNQPFRENGKLVFRPGGHGALIENLNDLNADVIFIKNIDNVVPDSLKSQTVKYKKAIAGLLIKLQQKAFENLQLLEKENISISSLHEISLFCEKELNNIHPEINKLNESELKQYMKSKLNRPIRVCGMVKNTGEPGGGPFLTVNADGTVSTQILESSQIDLSNPAEKAKMMNSTHFNPVDLVCGVKNYKGEKFNLLHYVDNQTGFISSKSKGGKELKALELPGLWNGAMSDWNTIFVEVPIETFNPVKTVNDLLRPEHQNIR
ncbi:DUF4301 family protein [Methylomonas sp. EFPC1]|nr:DUF4301 family protein [Methylomonas sp. EFPC1]